MISPVTALLGTLVASATGDVTRFRPAPGPDELIGMQTATPLEAGQYAASLTLSFARNPVVWRYADGSYDPLVTSQVIADLGMALGLAPNFDLGLTVPVALAQAGATTSLSGLTSERRSMSGAGFGDVRLLPRWALSHAASAGFGLALAAELTAPTGASQRFLGEGALSVTPRLIATIPFHLAERAAELTVSTGYRLRRSSQVAQLDPGSEIEAGAGGSVELLTRVPLAALVEVNAVTSASHPFGAEGLSASEALAGLRTYFGSTRITAAGGLGLTHGLGSPDYRVIVTVSFAPAPTDTDGDGIADREDACPTEPGDAAHHGCLAVATLEPDEVETPPPANCPPVPLGVNVVLAHDRCPAPDSDGDGIADPDDRCPNEKETINGIDDWDGCPDEGEGDTEYVPQVKIEIKETILFETAKATIKDESKSVLDQVALQILAHPEVHKVRVEGHTDSVGPEDMNLTLSQDRAESVRRYLIGRGVSKTRLEAVGYGETRPIASNNTIRGRAMNRRVEFVILE